MKENIKSFLQVISANLFVMLVGIIQSLLLPQKIGPEQYGFWSLYLLYIGYAGFFNLGIPDGIYLCFAGKKYKDLDKKKFRSYLNISSIISLIFLIIWIIIILIEDMEEHFKLIMILIGVSSFFACINNFVTMLDQATARFNIYSTGRIIEKCCIIFGILFYFIFNLETAIVIIIFSVLGKIITCLFYLYNTKPILVEKSVSYKDEIKDILYFMKIGLWLTLSSIGISTINSIGRFFIQYNMNVTALGQYSFIFSIAGLFTLFFSAVATVLFPMLKKSSDNNIGEIDVIMNICGLAIYLCIGPLYIFLNMFYKDYSPSFDCLVVMLSSVALLGKISIVYSTIFKMINRVKEYVIILIISIIICLIITYLTVKLDNSIFSIAIASYFSLMILCILSVKKYNSYNRDKLQYGFFYYLVAFVYFILKIICSTRIFFVSLYVSLILCLMIVIYRERMCVLKFVNILNPKGGK
ncbi:oligosaccharide flippase family protein [uncultured Fusobacterium sp.]|uniref:oligosaccharide flippase family protein n=1 Tax=uncultured Fusobacterium sp. TaxID=159267 RepID=UPI0025864B19|nr:oligosaccharide flippase family protein [uncultured Fusobacterium sp.]